MVSIDDHGAGELPVPKDGFFSLIRPGSVCGAVVRALYRSLRVSGTARMPRRKLLDEIDYSDSALKDALAELARHGIVRPQPLKERRSGRPDPRSVRTERRCDGADNGRRRYEELTPAGRLLGEIAWECDALDGLDPREARLPTDRPSVLDLMGNRLMRLIADRLLDGEASYSELLARVHRVMRELSSSTFYDNLQNLISAGVVEKLPASSPGAHDRYRLASLLLIVRPILLSARFRLKVTPSNPPWLAGNLPRLVELIVRERELHAPEHLQGLVCLHVLSPPGIDHHWTATELDIGGGCVTLPKVHGAAPNAVVRGTALAFAEALLGRATDGLRIEGDPDLARAALAALATAVPPPSTP